MSNNTTDIIVRVSTQHGKAEAGYGVVAIVNVVSAFGAKNLHNVYTLRVPVDFDMPADVNADDVQHGAISGRFDIRNAKSGQWLGTWVIAHIPGKHTLWDATDVPSNATAENTSQNAAQSVTAPIVRIAPATIGAMNAAIAARV